MTTEQTTDTTSADRPARDWARTLAAYRQPSDGRAAFELMVTALPLAGFWAAMWLALDVSVLLTLLLALPAGCFLVRMFMIQHDCGHGSFFSGRRANDWTGRIIGVFTLTPYSSWRRAHAIHHAGSGCLDRRGHGDIATMTVSEYRNASPLRRLGYRLYRHPVVMFGLGPAYLFILQHRLPIGLMREGWRPWASTMGTNAAIAVLAAGAIWLIGIKAFLLLFLPVTVVGASIGVWLFFVQHQFEDTVWEPEPHWKWHDAALNGSSYFDLPAAANWISANIGVHHVHHLSSRIPFYRLQKVLKDHPELRDVCRLTLPDSLKCVKLALWDEADRRLISFREARTVAA